MYKTIFNPVTYTQVCKAALSDNPQQNASLRDYVKNNLFSKNDIVFPQTNLEDHFVGAFTCYV